MSSLSLPSPNSTRRSADLLASKRFAHRPPPRPNPLGVNSFSDSEGNHFDWDDAVKRDGDQLWVEEQQYRAKCEESKRQLMASLRSQMAENAERRKTEKQEEMRQQQRMLDNDKANVGALNAAHRAHRDMDRRYAKHCLAVSKAVSEQRKREWAKRGEGESRPRWVEDASNRCASSKQNMQEERTKEAREVSPRTLTARTRDDRLLSRQKDWIVSGRDTTEAIEWLDTMQGRRNNDHSKRVEKAQQITDRAKMVGTITSERNEVVEQKRSVLINATPANVSGAHQIISSPEHTPRPPSSDDVRKYLLDTWTARQRELDESINERHQATMDSLRARDVEGKDAQQSAQRFRDIETAKRGRKMANQRAYAEQLMEQINENSHRRNRFGKPIDADVVETKVNPFRRQHRIPQTSRR